jgi:hypothetical protein
MVTLIVAVIVAVVSLAGGGFLGVRYGRKAEAKAQAAFAATQAAAEAKARAVLAQASEKVAAVASVVKL